MILENDLQLEGDGVLSISKFTRSIFHNCHIIKLFVLITW